MATTGVQTGTSALSSTTRRLKFEAPRARDFELAIGHFHRQATTVHGVRIRFSDMLPGGAASTRLRGDVLAAARSDVLGYEQRFGTYGYDRPTSPHIDDLARRGTTFESAWSAAPWTLPSIMSIMTSRYPSNHRVENDGLRLAPDRGFAIR